MAPWVAMLSNFSPWLNALLLFGAGGLLLQLLYHWWRTGAPPWPATEQDTEALLSLLAEQGLPEEARVFELGCGWGGLIKRLAKENPHLSFVGIEVSPFVAWVATKRTQNLPNVRIVRGNFFAHDLRAVDAVICYLMIKPMVAAEQLFNAQLRPGTRVFTIAFWFRNPERRPNAKRQTVAMYRW